MKQNYWELMETPIIVFVIYSLITMVFPLKDYLGSVAATIIGILIILYVFGIIGYRIAKEKNKELKPLKVGAWTGALTGFISAVIAILTYYLYPERIMQIIAEATKAGATAQITTTMIQVGLYIGLITSTLIYAGIGALIAWLSFLIFRNKK